MPAPPRSRPGRGDSGRRSDRDARRGRPVAHADAPRDGGRLDSLLALFLMVSLAVMLRLFWVQIADRERYDNPTGISYHRRSVLPAEKGELRDREGRPLARCVQVASISVNPQRVDDPARVASELAPLLGLSEGDLLERVSRRWRPVMLRRDVSAAAEAALAPLVQQGVLRFSDEPVDPTFSVYVFPDQFQPAPTERAQLAVILGRDPGELDAVLASEAAVVRCHDSLDGATAKRLEQLALAGLLVQQNPLRLSRAAWLEPVAEVLTTADDPEGGTSVSIRADIWQALAPLWEGTEPPLPETVAARLKAPFVFLAREVPSEVGEAVKQRVAEVELEGVAVHQEYSRERPQGSVAELLIGRTDVDERGISGLEALYNQILTGVAGFRRVTVSALGKPILQEREERVAPVHGKHVELTLDTVIQGYCEEALTEAVNTFDSDWGIAVVADPYTGEVLAMAEGVSATRDIQPMNRAMTIAYEPGSIMKPFTVMTAMEDGIAQPHTMFYCGRKIQVGRRTLHCIEKHGPETVSDGIRDSCNAVMVELARRLGQRPMESTYRRLGLLGRTGLGLAGQEAAGAIFADSADGTWGPLKLATVSYGKGIMCSAVGLTRAYCAIVNGGTLPKLHLVKRIRDRNGRVVVEQPADTGPRVCSERTAAELRVMLRRVVADKDGTGKLAGSDLYPVAGKTGTSVAYNENDRRVVSFMGFAPYDNPRLVVLVSVAEPRKGLRYGSTTCGAAFRSIVEKSLQYLGVPPTPAPKEDEA